VHCEHTGPSEQVIQFDSPQVTQLVFA